MNIFAAIRLVSFIALMTLTCSKSWALPQLEWNMREDEVEFGVTGLIGSTIINEPWVFESGYNGAFLFGDHPTIAGLEIVIGQTFSVDADLLLQSVSARVGRFGPSPPFGTFEVSIYEFDEISNTPQNRLAFSVENAAFFDYDIPAVPISTFDLSAFSITLMSGQTYMLTFNTLPNSSALTVQAATDIYDGGDAYIGASPMAVPMPEPSTLATMSVSLAALLLLLWRLGALPVRVHGRALAPQMEP